MPSTIRRLKMYQLHSALAVVLIVSSFRLPTTDAITFSIRPKSTTPKPKNLTTTTTTTATTTTTTTALPLAIFSLSVNHTLDNNQKQANKSLDHIAQASLLRPSFLRNLWSGKSPQQQAAESGSPAEEEEEVTQTIVVPMKEGEMPAGMSGSMEDPSGQLESANPNLDKNSITYSPLDAASRLNHHSLDLSDSRLPMRQASVLAATGGRGGGAAGLSQSDALVKPEASLQLTSTEMSSLLNDREAPEFYRERELSGDGVLVGEEQPRLGMAASGHSGFGYGGGGGGFSSAGAGYGGSGGFGGDSDAMLNQHRLLHAASEEGGGSGFNHRFGSQAYGGGLGGFGGLEGGGDGRLMQSPNEYPESAMGYGGASGLEGAYGGGGLGGHSVGLGGYSHDAGSLMRAGSHMGPESSYEGAHFGAGGFGSSGGYPNSPMLDRHASELYGSSGGGGLGDAAALAANGFHNSPHSAAFAGSSPSEFMGGMGGGGGGGGGSSLGRLMSAGSHLQGAGGAGWSTGASGHGGGLGAGGFGSSGSEDYSGRFGGGSPFGEPRGFASNQNNMLLRGNSESRSSGNLLGQSRGLMPLSPTIPSSDELPLGSTSSPLGSQYHSEESSTMSSAGDTEAAMRKEHPPVHEPLEDDPTDVREAEGSENESNDQQGDGELNEHTMQSRSLRGGNFANQENGPSLVINVPPPSESSLMSSSNNLNQRQDTLRHLVEFSRLGSAGYLAPSGRNVKSASRSQSEGANENKRFYQRILMKKSGHHHHHQHQPRGKHGGKDSLRDLEQQLLQLSSGSSSPRKQHSSYDPANNPAHAGKYIID